MTKPGLPDRRQALALCAAFGAVALGAAPSRAAADEFVFGPQVQGDPDAPVKVIEYASFTCPHCARFHAEVYPQLKRDYIDTGKASLELREVYFDRLGLWAGALARCGGAGRYFGFASLILEQQAEWTRSEDILAELQRMGRQGGLSNEAVKACVSDTGKLRKMVEEYQEFQKDPRLTGTPTLIVDGTKVDNPSFKNLSAAIDARLAG